MAVLSIILIVLFVIVSLLLLFICTIQDDNATGLGGIFGGGSDSTFGSGTSKFITKATTILAILFVVLALGVGLTNKISASDSVLDAAAATSETDSTWWQDDSATN